MPTERTLSTAEREELQEAAQNAAASLPEEAITPASMVEALVARVRRPGKRRDPEKELFECGALLAACLEMGLGWELIEVTFSDALTALAVVEMDRSLAILPFLAITAYADGQDLPIVESYTRLAAGERPPDLTRRGYAVLLP